VMLIETRMGRIASSSSAGAQGPMQFLPSTWAAYGLGGDIRAERDALDALGLDSGRVGANCLQRAPPARARGT